MALTEELLSSLAVAVTGSSVVSRAAREGAAGADAVDIQLGGKYRRLDFIEVKENTGKKKPRRRRRRVCESERESVCESEREREREREQRDLILGLTVATVRRA